MARGRVARPTSSAKVSVSEAKAIAANEGRAKYGAKRMAAFAEAGRKRKAK